MTGEQGIAKITFSRPSPSQPRPGGRDGRTRFLLDILYQRERERGLEEED